MNFVRNLLLAILFWSSSAISLANMSTLTEGTATLPNLVTTETSTVLDAREAESISVEAVIDVNTPAAKTIDADTGVNTSTEVLTSAAHDYTTGLKGQFTSTDTLPAGLSTSTDYFVIVVSTTTFKVATSYANAIAGTAVDITDTGTAASTITFTPTSIAGGSIKLQKSNDNTNWVDEGSATNITADANVFLEKDRPSARYYRVYSTLTAGRMSNVYYLYVKGGK